MSDRDQIEVAFTTSPQTILGEGPSWDAKNQLLYWIDIKGKKLHIFNPETKKNEHIDMPQLIGCVVPRSAGGVIVSLQDGFHRVDLKTCKITPIIDPETDKPGNRFNDGKCDKRGRFLCGTMDDDEVRGPVGALYCLDKDHSVKKILSDVEISNGIAFTPDYKTMYFIDSPLKRVDAFDYDLENCTLSNRRTVVKIEDGFPDGMTIDQEGMIWVAHWQGGCVTRWDPRTGNLLRRVKMPTNVVSSCAFGGKNLDVLYITTASVGVDTSKDPLAGTLFVLKNPGVRGIPEPEFLG